MGLLNPVIRASGPLDAKIMLVGEAPGETEEQMGVPFVGMTGQELRLMLKESGIDPAKCYMTNAFWSRPPNNKFEHFLVSKKESDGKTPPIDKGKYIHPELLPELDRLKTEIETVRPNLLIALGNKACWAVLGTTGISKIRGAIQESSLVPGIKVLPTYHPSAVMRQWDLMTIVLQDFDKAKVEQDFPEIRRPKRKIVYNPTIEEVEAFADYAITCPELAIDTETHNRQIEMVGFAPTIDFAFVIPLINKYKADGHYWPDVGTFARALRAIRKIVTHPFPKHIFQNGLYDIQYFWSYGMPVMIDEDTMILHHSLYPELPKGLGFLGSIYTNEASWKLLRKRKDEEMNKRDD